MESEKSVADIESLTSDINDSNVAVKTGRNRKLWIILISLTLGRIVGKKYSEDF